MADDFHIDLNMHAIETTLFDIETNLLHALTNEVAQYARGISPRRPRGGRLQASVTPIVDSDEYGPYGLVISLWYGRFLDPPARQLHRIFPFLPTALYTVMANFEAAGLIPTA